jgi:GT2 family glycosyltransferase
MLDDWAATERTLLSVLTHRPPRTEILVVHRGAYDDPYQLEGEVRFVRAAEDAGLIGSINAGLAACEAPIVHLLRPPVEVTEDWAAAALDELEDRRVGAVAPLVVSQRDEDVIVSAGIDYQAGGRKRQLLAGKRLAALEKTLVSPLGPSMWAGFYRRTVLEALTEDATPALTTTVGDDLADLDLALQLARCGWHAILAPGSIVRLDAATSRRHGWQAGRCAERLYQRHSDLEEVGTPARHKLACALEAIGGLIQPSRLLGWLGRQTIRFEASRWEAHRQQMAERAAELTAPAVRLEPSIERKRAA